MHTLTRTTIRRVNRGKNHSYKDGDTPLDGVTTLIGKGVPKPALPYWSAKCVAEYVADAEADELDTLRRLGRDGMVNALKGVPWGRRDAAAVRGTEVHGYAERLIKGEKVDVPDELAGHVQSVVKFLDDWRVAPVLVETVVAHRRYRYAGTLDLVADLPNGTRALFDYKTSASGIFPETCLQMAGYRYAEVYVTPDGGEMPMAEVGIDTVFAVWVRADGYDVYPLRCDDLVWKTFLCAAYIARRADEMKGWVGEAEHWSAP